MVDSVVDREGTTSISTADPYNTCNPVTPFEVTFSIFDNCICNPDIN